MCKLGLYGKPTVIMKQFLFEFSLTKDSCHQGSNVINNQRHRVLSNWGWLLYRYWHLIPCLFHRRASSFVQLLELSISLLIYNWNYLLLKVGRSSQWKVMYWKHLATSSKKVRKYSSVGGKEWQSKLRSQQAVTFLEALVIHPSFSYQN